MRIFNQPKQKRSPPSPVIFSKIQLSCSERIVLTYGSAIPVGSRAQQFEIHHQTQWFLLYTSYYREQSREVYSGWLPSSITVYNIRDYQKVMSTCQRAQEQIYHMYRHQATLKCKERLKVKSLTYIVGHTFHCHVTDDTCPASSDSEVTARCLSRL